MDEFAAGQLLDWYERIEKGVLTFAEHVPLVSENEAFQARMLASYLIDAAGLIDSVFRDLTKETNEVSRGRIKRDDCTIVDFYELHNKNFDLNNTRSIMLVSPARTRCPFSVWENKYTALPWWKAYNDLKHDRLANIRAPKLISHKTLKS